MLLFVCPDCEKFAVGDATNYLDFLERHTGAYTEKLTYKALRNYLNNTLRVFQYYDDVVGRLSLKELSEVLIEIFSAERSRLLAENKKKKDNVELMIVKEKNNER